MRPTRGLRGLALLLSPGRVEAPPFIGSMQLGDQAPVAGDSVAVYEEEASHRRSE